MPDEPEPSEKEYILFCDESDKEGLYFSNFYGGLLVGASQYQPVTDRLNAVKMTLNLFGEVKWQKVTGNYLSKYQALMEAFFGEVAAGNAKMRIMFRQNAQKPTGLSDEQRQLTYWLLYYQFVKHAFGFAHMPKAMTDRRLRIYFDQFPDTGEQAAKFKGFIEGLGSSREFREARLRLRREDITEVASHDHVLLQCLDVVLGSVCFRLNDKHKAKPAGSRRRGSRTVAKDELRTHILKQIQTIRPNFNIGITTGGGPEERWTMPYRHWCFRPSEFEYDPSKTKRGEKNNPADPT
jgi:hypothetical protein